MVTVVAVRQHFTFGIWIGSLIPLSLRFYSVSRLLFSDRKQAPDTSVPGALKGCLAVTYFHMGIHTIIGAGSFHGPVRDGKAWDQPAMAARLKLYKSKSRYGGFAPLIYSLTNIASIGDEVSSSVSFISEALFMFQSPSNDRVKPHEQLVWVSSTRYRASTPHLSTSWSRTAL